MYDGGVPIRSPVLWRWGWIGLALAFLLLRYQNTPGVLTERGVELKDTAPYYRLHRIERIVAGDWTYPLHDAALSFPAGFDVPWPPGLDYLVAAPLKLLGVRRELAVEATAAALIPLLSLPMLWLAHRQADGVEVAQHHGLGSSFARTGRSGLAPMQAAIRRRPVRRSRTSGCAS